MKTAKTAYDLQICRLAFVTIYMQDIDNLIQLKYEMSAIYIPEALQLR